ncbi:MAG: hypothetical protein KDI55_26060 [Anaerolineae bacterium]|nr:hypothetical protein [Anaerolineae bacterium]
MGKVAPPAFEAGNDASQWLLFVDSTTTTPLGQVKTFNWVQDIVTDEQMRVSDSQTNYTDKGVTVTGALEMWQDNDSAEIIAVGGQVLTVDDTPVTLIAVYHDAEATSGSAVDTYTFSNFRITQITAGPREGQSATYWGYTWRSTLLEVS